MRITAHNGAALFGGGERWAMRLLHGLQQRGHDVRLYCNHEVVAARGAEFGVETVLLRLGGDIAVHDAVRFGRQLRRERPDVLLNTLFKKSWLVGAAGRLAGVPHTAAAVVISSDTPRSFKYRMAARHLVDSWVLNSTAMLADFVAPLAGADRRRVVVVPNGADAPVRQRSREQVRAELGIPLDAPVLGTVARLARQKRLDRMVDVVARMPGVHFVAAGDGPLYDELSAQARAAGVLDRFHLLGNREDVGDILGALDVFTLSSDSEGMAAAMIEAVAAGVPVLTTPVAGAADVLGQEPLAGRIVPPDPAHIAAACSELLVALREPHRADAIHAACLRAASHFSTSRMVDGWEQVLTLGAAEYGRRHQTAGLAAGTPLPDGAAA